MLVSLSIGTPVLRKEIGMTQKLIIPRGNPPKLPRALPESPVGYLT